MVKVTVGKYSLKDDVGDNEIIRTTLIRIQEDILLINDALSKQDEINKGMIGYLQFLEKEIGGV